MEPRASFHASTPQPAILLGRYQGDLADSDHATAQTIGIMVDQHIRPAANDPAVQAAERWACQAFRGGPGYQGPVDSPEAVCYSIWWYAKHKLRFVHHDAAIRQLLGERDQLQLLISPSITVRAGRPEGDCAIYTLLICALLKCAGLGFEIVTTASDPARPTEFSHVFPRAVLPDGSRITLDASHGEYPGWEVPGAHQLRRQVWSESGKPITDKADRYNGLHEYRGLGDEASDAAFAAILNGTSTQGFVPDGGGALSIPSSQPSLFDSTLANLATAWTKIGASVIAPTTTYSVGPNGQVNYSAPSNSAVIPTSLSAIGSSGLGTVLALGAVAIVLVLMLGKSRS